MSIHFIHNHIAIIRKNITILSLSFALKTIIYFSVKLPQVIKVWQSKSAVGISLVNVCMDLFAVTSNVVYSYSSQFPFR